MLPFPKVKKKTKILILVNTLQSVASYVYGNHIGFFTYIAKKRPDLEIIFYTPQRMTIDMARTMAAKQALQDECDYLMFLDDDVLVPPDALFKLLEADKDIVAGLVIIRGYPFNNMAFKFKDKERTNLGFFNELREEVLYEKKWLECRLVEGVQRGGRKFKPYKRKVYRLSNSKRARIITEKEYKLLPKRLVELQPCDAVGFSCCLISCDLLKAMEPPYFVTGPHNTEDVYFCMKALSTLTPKPRIFLHTGIQCGHMMPAEAVEFAVKDKMKAFYADQAAMQQNRIPVRDATYLNRSLNALGYKGKAVLSEG